MRLARPDDADELSALRTTWSDELDLVQVVDADRFRFDIAGHVPRLVHGGQLLSRSRCERSAGRLRPVADRSRRRLGLGD